MASAGSEPPVAGPSQLAEPTPAPAPVRKGPRPPEKPYYWRLLGLDTAADIVGFRPGRKSFITAVVVGSLTAAITWDRAQAKRLRTEYQERVRHHAEEPTAIEELPRRVTVLSTRLPDDAQEDRALDWFKSYVKPVLNAAAVEYNIIHGNQPGALGRQLASRFRNRRVAALAPGEGQPPPGQLGYTDADTEARELHDGGTIIVGRTALKEYFWALREGQLSDIDLERARRATAPGSSDEIVEEEDLGAELAEDGFFDRALASASPSEPSDAATSSEPDTPQQPFSAGIYSSFASPATSDPLSLHPTSSGSGRVLPAPVHLPPQPPLIVIPYEHPLGTMIWWPLKLYTWLFCERHKVRAGGLAALRVIENRTRELEPPTSLEGVWRPEVEEPREWLNEKRKLRPEVREVFMPKPSGSRDLDIGIWGERYFDKAFRKWPANIAQARAMYEDELKPRIVAAHEEGGASESALRAERLEKETRWRRNLKGWLATRPGAGVYYDRERMDGSLRVFVDADEARDGR